MGYLELKFGPKVPSGAINLAWISVPPVSPEHNVMIADLAATIPANRPAYVRQPLDPTVSTYTVTLGNSGTAKTVTSAILGRYSTPITVLPPVSDPTGAWHLRVTDGVFHQKLTVSRMDKSWIRDAFTPGTEIVAIYTLPEKLLAPHNTRSGDFTEFIAEDEAMPISSYMVQLSYRDITSITDMQINGVNISFPFGTDAAGREIWDNANMVVDPFAGTIRFLNRTVSPTDDVRVSYGHRSPYITYHGFYDKDGTYRDLDLNPAFGHTYDNGKATNRLIGRVITLFLIPTAAYDYQAALSGEINIVRAHDILTGSRTGERTFLRWGADMLGGLPEVPMPSDDGSIFVPRGAYGSAKYGKDHFCAKTPQEESGSDNYSDPDGANADLSEYPSAAVLARIYVASTGTSDSVIITDARRRGGGVTDDPVARRSTLNGEQFAEANTCWDISGWDGDPVMLNGTTVIELPETILTRLGGRFTEEEVQEIVKKRLPVGVLPIIRYTGGEAVDEVATVTSPGGDERVVHLSRTGIKEVTNLLWNGTPIDRDTYEPGVDRAAGTITLAGPYPTPTSVVVSYRY